MLFRSAGPADLPQILGLMKEFYPLEGLTLDEGLAARGLLYVFEDPSRGSVFLLGLEDQDVGYCAVTAGVSLEFGGRYLLVDELYIRAPFRGRGFGRRTLALVEDFARTSGCGALRLEVHDANERAKEIYRQNGFGDDRRWVFTKPL